MKRFYAGQPIRFEPQEKGRFEPLSIEDWTKQFYALPPDTGGGIEGDQPNMAGSAFRRVELGEHH